ncbi:MAG: UvrD-helicase domain-containing protein, partial [Cyclobacteriaceae bacterium]
MPEKTFKIYRSSAGSGKTYTLAVEYLILVLKNPAIAKNVLAVTFTNKATQEMKERIIKYLHHLSTTEIKDNFYQDIQAATKLPDDQLKKQARESLHFILHNFSYFSVSTIDSFFQKVIRGFTREIGLHGNFNLELDHEKVLLELIDQLIEEVGSNERLTQWLIRFAENNLSEGKSWDVRKNMLALAGQLFNENFKAIEKDILHQENLVDELLETTQRFRLNFEKYFQDLAKKALKLSEDKQLGVNDFAHGQRGGVLSYFLKILGKNEFEPGSRIYSMLNNPDKWYTKTSKRKGDILAVYEEGMNELLQEAIYHYENNATTYLTATELQRYIYVLGLLTDLSRKLKEYREENETMLMSDAAHLLRQLIGSNDAPYIYEKIGSVYHNFFIDEFQDTSAFQWDNFKPLIANSLAQGRSNLVVGDIKQSIYRWRGGNWELLLRQLKLDVGENYINELNLQKNYRSLFNIIDFNNKLFTLAPIYLHKMLQSQLPSFSMSTAAELQMALAKIIEAYQDVWQDAPARVSSELQKGYVKVEFIDIDEEIEGKKIHWRELVLEKLPVVIEKLQDQKYKLRDIMILVRRQDEGREVINHLLKYKKSPQSKKKYQYEIISSESLYLENAATIKIIVAVFRWLLDAKDRVNLSQLAADYQQLIVKNNETGEEETIETEGIFIAIGHNPNTEFLKGQIKTDEVGYIQVVPGTTETNVPG